MPRLLPSPAGSSPQGSSLRLPANKRISTPVSHRLNSITDPSPAPSRAPSDGDVAAATNDSNAAAFGETPSSTPRRRSLASLRLPLTFPRRGSGTSKISHPAPPYDWVPEPIEEGLDGRVPIEGEKLRQLRNEDEEGKVVLWWRRKRVIALVVVIFTIVALAIGLGVGLSVDRGTSKKATGAENGTEVALEFPLGQWTVSATLVEANTGCTSNPDTWRCYPYTVGGETIFDLTIMNTSALYPPKSTSRASTGPAGLAANLTISSSNPFAIPFTNRSLTYIASRTNVTEARLEWQFEMTKSVMPASPVLAGGGAAECAFPGVMFLGALYLSASRDGSDDRDWNERDWPYAAHIRQRQEGSAVGAVDCRAMDGGIVSVPTASEMCDCVYRNY